MTEIQMLQDLLIEHYTAPGINWEEKETARRCAERIMCMFIIKELQTNETAIEDLRAFEKRLRTIIDAKYSIMFAEAINDLISMVECFRQDEYDHYNNMREGLE